jgi:hypothetical protein
MGCVDGMAICVDTQDRIFEKETDRNLSTLVVNLSENAVLSADWQLSETIPGKRGD